MSRRTWQKKDDFMSNPSKHYPLLATNRLAETRNFYDKVAGFFTTIDRAGYLQVRSAEPVESPELCFMTPDARFRDAGPHFQFRRNRGFGARLTPGCAVGRSGFGSRGAERRWEGRDRSAPREKQALASTALFALSFRVSDAARVVLKNCRKAIHQRRKIAFDSEDKHNWSSRRTVRPLGLYFWGQSWTVGAYCEWRSDFRSFRLDRMSAVRITRDAFELVAPVTLQHFIRAPKNS